MIFWAVIALAAVLIVCSWVWSYEPVISSALTVFITVVALLVTVGVQGVWGERTTDTHRSDLGALVTRAATSGAYFFLGTGVAEEKPVYRYISVDEDGGHRMSSAPVAQSVVYETDDQPYVEIVREYGNSWWIMPWPVLAPSGIDYRFFIPEGSIYAGYEVAP